MLYLIFFFNLQFQEVDDVQVSPTDIDADDPDYWPDENATEPISITDIVDLEVYGVCPSRGNTRPVSNCGDSVNAIWLLYCT